jgi:hypothetical protein
MHTMRAKSGMSSAAAVPPLVVVQDHVTSRLVELRGAVGEEPRTDHGVLLHLAHFVGVEAARLLEDGVADPDLADVVQLRGDAKPVALALEARALESAAARPLVEHDARIACDALDVRAGLGGVAHLGHADHAKDHALGELGALDHDGRHRREVLDQPLVLAGEAPGRAVGRSGRVQELQHPQHHVRRVAQRHGDHRTRAVARDRVIAAVERVGRRRVDRVGVDHVDDLAAHGRPACDRARAHRHHQAGEARGGVLAGLLERVVLAEREAQRVALARVDGAGVGAAQRACLGEDPLHEEVEVVDAAQLHAQARERVDARLPAEQVVGAWYLAGRHAPCLFGVAHRVAQLPLQPAHRGHRIVALLGHVERGREIADPCAQLDRVRKLLDVVGCAGVKDRAAQLALLGAPEHHHGKGAGLRALAQAAQEVQRRRAPLEVEVEEHHGRMHLEGLDLRVPHRLRGVHGDLAVRCGHRSDARGEARVRRHQEDHRRCGARTGGCAIGRGHRALVRLHAMRAW